MIRYVYLGGQILWGGQQFCFYDTISEVFVRFDDENVFDSQEHLMECMRNEIHRGERYDTSRFTTKIFVPPSGHTMEVVNALQDWMRHSIPDSNGAYVPTGHLDVIRRAITEYEVEREVMTEELRQVKQEFVRLRMKENGWFDKPGDEG